MTDESQYTKLEITDVNDELSVVNMLPSAVSAYIKAIPEEVWLLSEEDLKQKAKATVVDSLLRNAFWLEYNRAIRSDKRMNPISIYGGNLSKYAFYREVCTNSFRLAYMCTPPTDYTVMLDHLLYVGLNEYLEILSLPNVNAKGQVDSRLAAVKQKIIEDVANRRRGKVAQNINMNSKNLNLNMNAQVPQSNSVQELEAQLAALEEAQQKQLPESTGGVSYAKEESTEHEVIEVYAEETL